jgi:hypothetical protein
VLVDPKNLELTRQQLWYRRLNWTIHSEIAFEYFQKVVREAKEAGYFETLYASPANSGSAVRLFAGSHPVESMPAGLGSDGRPTSQRLISEGGAELVISLSVTGEVAVLLYPFISERHARREKQLVWAIYSDPTEITRQRLKRMTDDFFTYMRASSVFLTPSVSDKLRVRWLALRSRRYDGEGLVRHIFNNPWISIIGFMGAIAGIIGLFLTIKYTDF